MIPLHFDFPRGTFGPTFTAAAVRDPTASNASTHAAVCRHSTVVALLDNEKKTREAIEDALQVGGYSMLGFDSASKFFAKANPRVGCCLILDSAVLSTCAFEEQQRLISLSTELPVIHLMSAPDVRAAVKLMKSGAANLLLKPVDLDALISAVHRAVHANQPTNGDADVLSLLRHHRATLTPRECQVMAMLTNGKRNKQIADALEISIITVKVHRSRIMRKMGVASFADLVLASMHLDAGRLKNTDVTTLRQPGT